MFNNVMMLVLGWLFGLLGPSIVDAIGKDRRREEVRQALFTELRATCLRLIFTYYQIEVHFKRDRKTLEWMLEHLKRTRDPSRFSLIERVEKLLAKPDNVLEVVADAMKAAPDEIIGFKTIEIPLTFPPKSVVI